jgi:hypothetical protein
VTTHAPLRSQRTKAKSVCHGRVLGDGDAPTSPVKIQGYSKVRYLQFNNVAILTLFRA